MYLIKQAESVVEHCCFATHIQNITEDSNKNNSFLNLKIFSRLLDFGFWSDTMNMFGYISFILSVIVAGENVIRHSSLK